MLTEFYSNVGRYSFLSEAMKVDNRNSVSWVRIGLPSGKTSHTISRSEHVSGIDGKQYCFSATVESTNANVAGHLSKKLLVAMQTTSIVELAKMATVAGYTIKFSATNESILSITVELSDEISEKYANVRKGIKKHVW